MHICFLSVLFLLLFLFSHCSAVFARELFASNQQLKKKEKEKTVRVHQESADPWPCEQSRFKDSVFCNTDLPLATRVAEFVENHIPESCWAGLLSNSQAACPQAGLPASQRWSEALHGPSFSPGVHFSEDGIASATQFPMPNGVGATYDRKLWARFGDIVGTEARAMFNSVVSGGVRQAGLTFYSFANINLVHSQLWGRGQEVGNAEEPLVNSIFGSTIMRAGQYNASISTRYPRLAFCAKHFLLYSQENWGSNAAHTISRHNFDAVASPEDLAELAWPAFEATVHVAGGGALSYMSSYNAVTSGIVIDGVLRNFTNVPNSVNVLLNAKLSSIMNNYSYLTSDCDAVSDVFYRHNYTATPEEAVALWLKAAPNGAGGAIDCGGFASVFLQSTLDKGLLTKKDVTEALKRIYRLLFLLGRFDPPSMNPYNKISKSNVNTAAHQQAAYEAAADGVVLLEHWTSAFPLKPGRAAVVGPNGNVTWTQLGSYYGQPPFVITILDGVTAINSKAGFATSYAKGVDIDDFGAYSLDDGCTLIEQQELDAVILALGINQHIESEAHDRVSYELSGLQRMMARHVVSCASQKNIPVVVVIMSGGQVDTSFLSELQREEPMIGSSLAALLWTAYPGMMGGQAIADVIYGSVAPSGRLPASMYPARAAQEDSMLSFRFKADERTGFKGRLYRYRSDIVYPTGHGLSTTKWAFQVLGISNNPAVLPTLPLAAPSTLTNVTTITFSVANVGSVASKFVLLVTVLPPDATARKLVRAPIAGFEKTATLQPGGLSQTLNVDISYYTVSDWKGNPVRGTYTWSVMGYAGIHGTFVV